MKKIALILLGCGVLSLAGSMVLLVFTESIFSTVLLYLSVILNILGLYILIWKRKGGRKDDN